MCHHSSKRAQRIESDTILDRRRKAPPFWKLLAWLHYVTLCTCCSVVSLRLCTYCCLFVNLLLCTLLYRLDCQANKLTTSNVESTNKQPTRNKHTRHSILYNTILLIRLSICLLIAYLEDHMYLLVCVLVVWAYFLLASLCTCCLFACCFLCTSCQFVYTCCLSVSDGNGNNNTNTARANKQANNTQKQTNK